MSDQIDHVAEARKLTRMFPASMHTDELIAAAQAHAQLALVEQARVANLIAILALAAQGVANQTMNRGEYMNMFRQINPEIVSALGIKTGDGDE